MTTSSKLPDIPEFPSWTLPATGFFVIVVVSIAFRQRIKQGEKHEEL